MKSVISGLIVALLLMGCAKKAPDCNDKRTKEMVIQIAKNELIEQMGRAFGPDAAEATKKLALEVINVRTTNFNQEIGKYECTADLKMTGEGKNESLPITYTSELVDNGKNFYVRIYGL